MPRKPKEKCLHLINNWEIARADERLSSPTKPGMSGQYVLEGSPRNEWISMGSPGKDGISFWGEQEEEKGGMKIRLHKGRQRK